MGCQSSFGIVPRFRSVQGMAAIQPLVPTLGLILLLPGHLPLPLLLHRDQMDTATMDTMELVALPHVMETQKAAPGAMKVEGTAGTVMEGGVLAAATEVLDPHPRQAIPAAPGMGVPVPALILMHGATRASPTAREAVAGVTSLPEEEATATLDACQSGRSVPQIRMGVAPPSAVLETGGTDSVFRV